MAAQETYFLKQMFGSPTTTRPGDYSPAVAAGTSVVPLIHNLHGGRARLADRRLRHIARKCGNKIAPDEAALSPVARRFIPYYSQRLSCAAMKYVAHRIRSVLKGDATAPVPTPPRRLHPRPPLRQRLLLRPRPPLCPREPSGAVVGR